MVRGEDGLILVDPGIDGSELNQLADDGEVGGRTIAVGAGDCSLAVPLGGAERAWRSPGNHLQAHS